MKMYLVHKPSWVWHYLQERPTSRFLLPVHHFTMLHEIVNDLVKIGAEEEEERDMKAISNQWIPLEAITELFSCLLRDQNLRYSESTTQTLRQLWKLDKTTIRTTIDSIVSNPLNKVKEL